MQNKILYLTNLKCGLGYSSTNGGGYAFFHSSKTAVIKIMNKNPLQI